MTGMLHVGSPNLLAVRVLNPTDEPIDGIVLKETPHRNKVNAYYAGGSYNHGGIVDSVELLVLPRVSVDDVFVRADPATGWLRVQAEIYNAMNTGVGGRLTCSVAPAAGGVTLAKEDFEIPLGPGTTPTEAKLYVPNFRLWELNDPFLYRVTVRVAVEGQEQHACEQSVRCGFRAFRFENGYFPSPQRAAPLPALLAHGQSLPHRLTASPPIRISCGATC